MQNAAEIDPSRVVRVIIAGNSIGANPAKQQKNMSSLTLRTFDTKDMLVSLKLLDEIVSNLSLSVDVDLMPGEFDPSNFMLPQQPMHHCLFPKSATNRAFNGVPNPYQFELEGRLILGTSGQNIDDIRKFTTVDDSIQCMKNSLKWSHIAPTCPDTLPCYPYSNSDPFIISRCPHVYFVAQNDSTFKTEMIKRKHCPLYVRNFYKVLFPQILTNKTSGLSRFRLSKSLKKSPFLISKHSTAIKFHSLLTCVSMKSEIKFSSTCQKFHLHNLIS